MSTRHLFFSWVLVYFSFSRISSALIPLASSFFSTASASAFFLPRWLSDPLWLSLLLAFSADFKAARLAFKSAFRESMFAVIDAISVLRDSMVDYFSAIWDAKSLTTLGLFLLPLVLGIRIPSSNVNCFNVSSISHC